MAVMVVSAVIVSLSGVFITDAGSDLTEENTQIDEESKTWPIYVPILVSFSMPITCAFFILFIKRSMIKLKLDSNNWVFAYNLIFSIAFAIASIIKFVIDPSFFDIKFFIIGIIGSFFGNVGCLFSQSAIGSGAPLGPI